MARAVFTLNLWTLDDTPNARRPWGLPRRLAAAREEGFDAVHTAASPGIEALLKKNNLRYMGLVIARGDVDGAALLTAQHAAGAEIVNVQLGDGDTDAAAALREALRLRAAAARCGIRWAIETHRNTATETPERLGALAAAYTRRTNEVLPLTIDSSHHALVKHLRPARFGEALLARPDLIQAARMIHLRPFNGQHAQVPVMDTNNRLTPEFKAWLDFAAELLRLWLAGPRPGDELWIVPEIGPATPHGYNLSVFPPAWAQARRCHAELRRLWKRLQARHKN
jgi:hypothetical protein